MEIFNKNPLKKLLLLGLFLNVFIYLVTGPLLNMKFFFEILPLFFSDILFSAIFFIYAFGIALIPYVILGILWKNSQGEENVMAGLKGVLIFIVINNIFFYGVYFMDLFSDDPSSTGGLAFFAYLFYTPFVAIIGYVIGKGVYRLRNKSNKS
jgi:hypothetical protein